MQTKLINVKYKFTGLLILDHFLLLLPFLSFSYVFYKEDAITVKIGQIFKLDLLLFLILVLIFNSCYLIIISFYLSVFMSCGSSRTKAYCESLLLYVNIDAYYVCIYYISGVKRIKTLSPIRSRAFKRFELRTTYSTDKCAAN